MTEMPSTLAEAELGIIRTFDAPRDRLWRAFSEADRLACWWGPKDVAMPVATLDFRPGGLRLGWSFRAERDRASGRGARSGR
jgi:uncharacterized protein YndB with AHSA1/START domain